ncbi:MAG: metallophosphoesterase [Chthoniobacterales bacterium]|nr:metallophosphoesterase [Chthoniobacterales bacterium]
MSIVTIIIAAVLLADVLWWFTSARLLRRAPMPRWVRVTNSVIIALLLAGLVVLMATRRAEARVDLPQFVTSVIYIWHLLVLPVLLPLVLLGGLAVLLWWTAKRLKTAGSTADQTAASGEEALTTRRGFLAAAAALAPPILCFSLTGFALPQLNDFRTRRFTIPIADLPPSLDGLTIAHVSDLHVGRFTKGAVLRQMVDATNDLRADLVLLTGDLINGAANELPEAIEMVRRFDTRTGVYMVEGNHDLFPGRAEFEGSIKGAGIPLLVNETVPLNVRGFPIELLGLRWGAPDDEGARPQTGDDAIAASLARLLAQRNTEAFPILLAHHPHAFEGAAAAGLPLTLAGHTHGGQLMLNEETGLGPVMFRYWSGLYSRGGRHLVVSNGAGNWFPLRTSAPAEIVHLTLRRG